MAYIHSKVQFTDKYIYIDYNNAPNTKSKPLFPLWSFSLPSFVVPWRCTYIRLQHSPPIKPAALNCVCIYLHASLPNSTDYCVNSIERTENGSPSDLSLPMPSLPCPPTATTPSLKLSPSTPLTNNLSQMTITPPYRTVQAN